jgi:cytochrome oxidase Cu insertion factor (SCO1/SenC/PrrC family)
VPGMNSGLSPDDPTLVAAFQSALRHQGLIVVAVFVLLWLAWSASRNWIPAADGPRRAAEPAGRRVLRIGFGLLWLLDGILQAQPRMAGGLPSQVIEPTAQASPRWVQDLVNAGGTVWSNHPITLAAASVWVQAGIGIWLLAAPRGRWSRAAGLASVAWGLVVWVWGESFGGIFAPGLSWLTGAPGAVLLYCVAGALIALPARAWGTQRTGRLLLAGAGAFFAGMAVLQAWPGRGYWQGTIHGQPGTLAGMIAGMVQTSQPHVLSAVVSAFGAFDTAHGFAVNLFVVLALAAVGTALLTGRPRLARVAVIAAAVLCLADWVLVQDFGFLGGVGTDPNSMIPTILLLAGGYLALTSRPAEALSAAVDPVPSAAVDPGPPAVDAPVPPAAANPAAASSVTPDPAPVSATGGRWRDWLRPDRARAVLAATGIGTVTALGAAAVVAIGVVPMAAASVNPTADPILAEAMAGYAPPLNAPAPEFRLTDQHGRTVTLASLRGKAVLLTFLDPVCTTDCPLIAQEFKAAGRLLGSQASRVELVAVAANPTYYSTQFTQAFDQQEGLSTVPDWLYLTGTLPQLEQIWNHYGVDVEDLPAGAMTDHADLAIVIDPSGNIRQEISADPGPGTTSTQSSWAGLLAADAREALGQS